MYLRPFGKHLLVLLLFALSSVDLIPEFFDTESSDTNKFPILLHTVLKGVVDLDYTVKENIFNLCEYLNKKPESITACIMHRPRHKKIITELNKLGAKVKLISDGDVSGALLVTDEKYDVDIFLGIGGGPEGVLAASALDSFNCFFQGRFLFDTDEDKLRANKMGIKNLTKKYELSEIVKGDTIFCATGITTGDLVSGIKIENNELVTETLVTHKSSGIKKNITKSYK